MASRSKAPKVEVKIGHRDMRQEILADLDKKHPEFVHAFQNMNANVDEMSVNEQEWVKENTYNEEGGTEIKKWRRDGIARTPKKYAEELRKARSEASAETVEHLYCDKAKNEEWKENTVGRRTEMPKNPAEIGNNGGM